MTQAGLLPSSLVELRKPNKKTTLARMTQSGLLPSSLVEKTLKKQHWQG